MGEQTFLELEGDENIIEEAEKAKENSDGNKKANAKKRAGKKKESGTEGAQEPPSGGEGEGDGQPDSPDGGAAGEPEDEREALGSEGRTGDSPEQEADGVRGKGKQPRNTGGHSKADKGDTTGPRTREDGWNVNIIGKVPRRNPNPYFEGLIAYANPDSASPSLIAFKDIRTLVRVVYIDDIHLENPSIIETRFFATGTFHDVSVSIEESEFTELLAHSEVKATVYYSYVSCERAPKRNYQLKNIDRWPTEQEIKDMDKHMDSIDYALMGYGQRKAYREEKQKKGEIVEEPIEETVPPPVDEFAQEEEPEELDEQETDEAEE